MKVIFHAFVKKTILVKLTSFFKYSVSYSCYYKKKASYSVLPLKFYVVKREISPNHFPVKLVIVSKRT